MRIISVIGSVVVGLAWGSVVALAQTSQISGVIKDPSGSAIPGAAIKATQTATAANRYFKRFIGSPTSRRDLSFRASR